MPHPKVKIADNSGNEVAVTSNALDVNIAGGTADIDIGDVSLLLGGTAADTGLGTYGAQTLRVTLAADDALTLLMVNDLDTIAANLHFKAPSNSYSAGGTPSGIISMAFRQDTLGDYFSGIGVNDADWTYLQVNSKGGLYVTGSEVENSAVQSEPLLIGGRFDSSARTLGDGDAGAVALNASGHMIMDVVDGGQLDTIIDTLETTLTAIETDQAAIEALLITIDSDTDAIKTAVQILDDWDDSNYANVNINLAGTDVSADEGNADAGTLRITIADDDNHFGAVGAASDVDGNIHGQLRYLGIQAANLVDIAGCVGADGTTGPAKVMSIGGTVTVGGAIQEIAVDASGQLQVDVLSAPSTAVTNAGTFVVQEDGAALTALQIIDDWDSVHDGSASSDGVQVMGEAKYFDGSALPGTVSNEGDATRMAATLQGILYNMPVNQDGSKSPIDQTTGLMKTTHGITALLSDDNDTVGTSAEKISGADGDVACRRIDIMAHPSNTGEIWVGDSSVSTNGLNGGIRLLAGDFYSIDIDNTADVYVVASVNGENVCFNYFT